MTPEQLTAARAELSDQVQEEIEDDNYDVYRPGVIQALALAVIADRLCYIADTLDCPQEP